MLAAEAVEPVRHYTAAEFAAEFERGRREGARQADTGVDRRFVEFRSEVSAVQNGLFSRLGEAEKLIADQIRVVLPDLAVEVAKRVFWLEVQINLGTHRVALQSLFNFGQQIVAADEESHRLIEFV